MATVTEANPNPESSDLPVLDYWMSLEPDVPPVRGRELLAVSLLVVLCDATIIGQQMCIRSGRI